MLEEQNVRRKGKFIVNMYGYFNVFVPRKVPRENRRGKRIGRGIGNGRKIFLNVQKGSTMERKKHTLKHKPSQ